MTKKPCPGCGEVNPRRKATEVCSRCKKAIEDAAVFHTFFETEIRNKQIRFVAEEAHLPSFRNCRDFREVFAALTKTISIPSMSIDAKSLISGQKYAYVNVRNSTRVFPPGVVEELECLYAAAQDASKASYLEGQTDMLQRLGYLRNNIEKFTALLKAAEEKHVQNDG